MRPVDYTQGSGELRRCRKCMCTDRKACVDEEGNVCWWVEDDLCSHCEFEERMNEEP